MLEPRDIGNPYDSYDEREFLYPLLRSATERGTGMNPGEYEQSSAANAFVCCPDCGNVASLSQHTVDPDGSVHPSLVCPHDGCKFHEWVILDEWQAVDN